MFFEAHYYVIYLSQSRDRARLHQVLIKAETWEAARKTIVDHVATHDEYCHVDFVKLEERPGLVLWK